MQKRELIFKYQSHIYNFQSNSYINHRGMKIVRNNKFFLSINVINVQIISYNSKEIIRHCHYRSDPKLCIVMVSIRIILCSFHSLTTILSLSWYLKTKESVHRPRYGQVYYCKYSQIIGCHNNWIIINSLCDGTDE